MTDPEDRKTPEITPQRKRLYYGGMALMILGGVLCLVGFITFAGAGMNLSFQGPGFGSFDLPGGFGLFIAGMVLLVIGGVVKGIGARGTAGSGLVLDPEKAREDLHPYTHMAGGMIKDAADAFREGEPDPKETIKVRCPNCRALNDEGNQFCGQCGKAL